MKFNSRSLRRAQRKRSLRPGRANVGLRSTTASFADSHPDNPRDVDPKLGEDGIVVDVAAPLSSEVEVEYRNSEHIPDFELIRQSGLFDHEYYLREIRKRSIEKLDVAPIEHYYLVGEALGISPNVLFDPHYYATENPDVRVAGYRCLNHYLAHGDAEGRNPHPLFDVKFVRGQLGTDFVGNTLAAYLRSRAAKLQPHRMIDPEYIWERQRSMSPTDDRPCLVFFLEQSSCDLNPTSEFDMCTYKMLHPDIREMNPFYHYVRYGLSEGRKTVKAKNSLRGIATQVDETSQIEPGVVNPLAALTAMPYLELYDVLRVEYLLSRRLAAACGTKQYRHVVLAPWLKKGGAERVIINLIRATLTLSIDDNVLIICTQSDNCDAASWLPYSSRWNLVCVHDVIDEAENTYVAFCNWLRVFQCKYLYIVNSAFGWNCVTKFARPLRSFVTTLGFAFCYDYDEFGGRCGYAWTHLRRAYDSFDAFVSDNGRTIRQFCDDQLLDSNDRKKFHQLYQPVDPTLRDRVVTQLSHNLRSGGDRRHAVLWAGRFDRQKGMALALEIAAGLPEMDFVLYGGTHADLPRGLSDLPANAILRGVYEQFADLPLYEMSLFLHTSHWDGLPNVLLEAGYTGLPIVATAVGGVPELIEDQTGWLVAHNAGAAAYQGQIKRILANPIEAIERCRRLAVRIDERHSMDRFVGEVSHLLAAADENRLRALAYGE